MSCGLAELLRKTLTHLPFRFEDFNLLEDACSLGLSFIQCISQVNTECLGPVYLCVFAQNGEVIGDKRASEQRWECLSAQPDLLFVFRVCLSSEPHNQPLTTLWGKVY